MTEPNEPVFNSRGTWLIQGNEAVGPFEYCGSEQIPESEHRLDDLLEYFLLTPEGRMDLGLALLAAACGALIAQLGLRRR